MADPLSMMPSGTNAELVTHLDQRETYMEEQDALLQKIFAIKR